MSPERGNEVSESLHRQVEIGKKPDIDYDNTMIRAGIVILLLSVTTQLFGQDTNFVRGYVVSLGGDTTYGQILNKNIRKRWKIILIREEREVKFDKKWLKEFRIGADRYVKIGPRQRSRAFAIKLVSGNVNLYLIKRSRFLSLSDADFVAIPDRVALKIYCNDYPNFKDSARKINRRSIEDFLLRYNAWKSLHPESKSYLEKNFHHRPAINVKASLCYPSFGFEIALGRYVSLNSLVVGGLAFSSRGVQVLPYSLTDLRVYYNTKKRERLGVRTYKFSGDFISGIFLYDLTYSSRIIAVQYGWQRVSGKYTYSNFSIGPGITTTGYYTLVWNFETGWKF
jgi:hypothetical protein